MRAMLLVVVGCGTTPPTAPTSVPPPIPGELVCQVDDDCTWGEIDRDVTSPDDCDCQHCNAALVNIATARRRRRAWSEHCKLDRQVLNDRKLCPLHDCVAMPIACRQGRCVEQ